MTQPQKLLSPAQYEEITITIRGKITDNLDQLKETLDLISHDLTQTSASSYHTQMEDSERSLSCFKQRMGDTLQIS